MNDGVKAIIVFILGITIIICISIMEYHKSFRGNVEKGLIQCAGIGTSYYFWTTPNTCATSIKQ